MLIFIFFRILSPVPFWTLPSAQSILDNMPWIIILSTIVGMLFFAYPPRWLRFSYQKRLRCTGWLCVLFFLAGIWQFIKIVRDKP